MDQNTLVEGGDAGLVSIANAFSASGFPVKAIYLVKRTSVDGDVDWVIPVVLATFRPGSDRDFIYELARLRRDKKLPFIDEQVRINAVPADHIEASRVIDYATRLGEPPIVIRNAIWDGLYIDYALVTKYPPSTTAAA